MADQRRLGVQDALWLEMNRPNITNVRRPPMPVYLAGSKAEAMAGWVPIRQPGDEFHDLQLRRQGDRGHRLRHGSDAPTQQPPLASPAEPHQRGDPKQRTPVERGHQTRQIPCPAVHVDPLACFPGINERRPWQGPLALVGVLPAAAW